MSNISNHATMIKKLEIIRDFGNKMGYEINEIEYTHYLNHRKCYTIELISTCDCDGYPYNWSWYLDDYTEVKL